MQPAWTPPCVYVYDAPEFSSVDGRAWGRHGGWYWNAGDAHLRVTNWREPPTRNLGGAKLSLRCAVSTSWEPSREIKVPVMAPEILITSST